MDKLSISFSGGRTSAYMTWWIMNEWPDRDKFEIKIVFANTGKEVAGTLDFVNECSKRWGIEIIWVEARHRDDDGNTFSKKGWSVRHNIVTYESASRKGEPFEEMIGVLGIPSTNSPFCSSQLKRSAIESYLSSIGWHGYYKAIGIRVDEIDRLNPKWRGEKIKYFLINPHPTFKRDVVLWWDKMDFDLEIDPDEGNCDCCWKKDMPRLVRIAKNNPKAFDWWQEMTDRYGHFMPREMKKIKPPYNFYRGDRSPNNILELAKLTADQMSLLLEEESVNNCSESCEPYS